MDYQKELNELFNQMQDKLANGISVILRSIKDRDKRIIALKNMEKQPSIDILKRVYKIAIENEDYETCEAIKIYSKEKGINI